MSIFKILFTATIILLFLIGCGDEAEFKDTDSGTIYRNDDSEVITLIARAGSDQTLKVGEVVKFDASGSRKNGAVIVSYEWSENGNILSTDSTFSLSNLILGKHTIKLTIVDKYGEKTSDTKNIQIVKNIAPIAQAGADQTVTLNEAVTLNGLGSTDSDGSIVSYLWKDGNTTLSTERIFTKLYFTMGTHNISLTVTDDYGTTNTDNLTLIINGIPTANAGADQTVTLNEAVTLNGLGSTDSDGSIVSYLWKDGNTTLSTEKTFTKSDFTVGTHTIILTVTDNDGSIITDSLKVHILPNLVPTVKAGLDQTVIVNTLVTFNGSNSTDSDGSIVSYLWKDGNTTLSTEKIFTKSDFVVGTHTISLVVTDNDGDIGNDSLLLTINAIPIAKAGSNLTVTVNEPVTFDGSNSIDIDGNIVSYLWEEGTDILSTEKIFTKSDFAVGIHTISLTVTDNDAIVARDTINVKIVANVAPIAKAGLDQTVTINDQVTLNGSNSTDNDGSIVSYLWREMKTTIYDEVPAFDSIIGYPWQEKEPTIYDEVPAFNSTVSYVWKDGIRTLSTEKIFKKSDFTVGTHTVILTVTDDDKATATDILIVKVLANVVPIAKAGLDQIVTVNYPVTFNGSNSIDSDGSIVSYLWKDGNTILSTEKIFTKSDFTIGTHTISLAVTDNDGDIATDSFNLSIEKKVLPIKQTGQTRSYIANDDGYYQKGVSISYVRDDANEVVTDYATKLMWQDDSDAKTIKKDWESAKNYCLNLDLAGYTDWYLPSKEELQSIVNYGRYNPALNEVFKNYTSYYYWSSTTNTSYISSAWAINFYYGHFNYKYRKTGSTYVRCVRAEE